jgi:hypothetical protein
MTTIYLAIAAFGIAALAGVYLLSLVLRDKETPKGFAMLHGVFAVTGLALLIGYCVKNTPGPILAIAIFSVAALGGLILIYRDITGNKVPKWLAIVHGLAAVTGYVTLLVFAFSGH